MTGYTRKTIVLFGLLGMFIGSESVFAAADYAREKRWADEILQGLIVGDSIYLTQKNSHQFLGLYAAASEAKTGVVLVHGMGVHPDWGVIGTLRQQLFDFGYTTLSIQMPVLASDADFLTYPVVFPEAIERLQLAVAYLRGKGFSHIVIVSHSMGSRMSRLYMITKPIDVDAWIALSLTQGETFDGIGVPVLDIYGENDLSHVLASTELRRFSLRANLTSKQIRIPNADHFFGGQEDAMIREVKRYLDSLEEVCGL